MIDTVRVETPYLNEEQANLVKAKLRMYQGVELKNGMELYCKYNNRIPVDNTYHYSVYVSLVDERWVSNFLPSAGKNVPMLEKCEPYIIMEFSVSKYLFGHNVFGGTDDKEDIGLCVEDVLQNLGINKAGEKLNIYSDDCILTRIDIAYCYKLNDAKAYMARMNKAYYPRRVELTNERYKNGDLYFAGSTTTVKFYNKYDEYKKHDYKKTKNDDILNFAYNILRIEVEVKKKKLTDMFYKNLKLKDLDMNKIIKLYDKEVSKIYNGIDFNSKVIKHDNVYDYLHTRYSASLAGSIYTTYMLCVQQSKMDAKRKLKNEGRERTYYRHMKYLRECNISINNDVTIDVRTAEQREFYDFVPSSKSKQIV